MPFHRTDPTRDGGAAPAGESAGNRKVNNSNKTLSQSYLARPHPLLADACHCGGRGICLCCRRWARHDREVSERRVAWRAHERGL